MNVRIEKIEITSFGKLKNTVVDLAGGINILCAPNESGKSTLAAFIKFVFYGFAGQRLQSISENEKKLYTPWEGEVSEGAVAIECDEGRFVIERRVTASGREKVTITDRRTGNRVHSGEIPGEVFFGVSEDIFSRTLFFRQLTTPQGKDELLAERLRNIAISADERIGTGKAVERLTQARNELKNRLGNGLIPRLTSERDELNAEISESDAFRAYKAFRRNSRQKGDRGGNRAKAFGACRRTQQYRKIRSAFEAARNTADRRRKAAGGGGI